MANFHWSVSSPQIREDITPRAAWLIWGRCPVGLTGSLVLGVGLEIHQRLVQFGMANFHWSVSSPQIREDSTPRAAWLIWGRCPVSLTGSLVLECWNEAGRLSAERPSAHHDYTLLLSPLFLLFFSLFYIADSSFSWEGETLVFCCSLLLSVILFLGTG